MSMTGIWNIAINKASLSDGHSIAAYLTSASDALITSETIGGNEYSHSKGPESHIDGSAYVPAGDYLSSVGVVDNAGNWVPFTLNAAGELPVAATVNFAGDYAEDSAHVSGDIGLFQLSVRRDVRSSGTSTDGDYASFNTNSVGELYVKDTDVATALAAANSSLDAIEASVAQIDLDLDAVNSSLDAIESDVDAIRLEQIDQGITLDAILADTATIDSQTLSIQNTLLALSKAEDAAHASGDQGIQALAVRKDAQGSNVNADGDYSSLQTWSEGSLKVVDVANGAILQQVVTVGVAAVALPASALASRKSLMLQNISDKKMYIGSATVTTSGATRGIEVPPNSFMELEVGPAVTVYGICGTAAKEMAVLELS